MSNSVWPHGRQPTRLPRPRDSPGNNTGVGCHFLLQCMKSHSVVSDSLRLHGLQPTSLLCPWDFPGKSTGVGYHCLLQENSIEVTKNIKSRMIVWSSNSASGYFSQENKNTNSKIYMHFYVHCSIICNSQDMGQPKCPLIGEWIYIYIYIFIYIYIYLYIYYIYI